MGFVKVDINRFRCWIELWRVKESTRRRVWSLVLSGGADALSWTWHYETKYGSFGPSRFPAIQKVSQTILCHGTLSLNFR